MRRRANSSETGVWSTSRVRARPAFRRAAQESAATMDRLHSNKRKIRIIGGHFAGRRIAVPSRPGLRPPPDRVRETLFNWLGQRLDGLACLDLFAGSGALGFEAASRGAARVVMVEQDRSVFLSLKETKAVLGAAQVELVQDDAFG